MEKKSSSGMNRVVTTACWSVAAVAIILALYSTNSGSIWADEAFSLKIIKLPYEQIIGRTAADVHPPLYYFLLKFFVDLAHALFAGLSAAVVGKCVSVIPQMLLMLLAATKVRRTWGNLTAALFALCAAAMPKVLNYGVEIRMYSWALLFVTCSYIWSYDILRGGGFRSWCLFTLCSLAAAYTHYFALVTVAFTYLFVLIRSLCRDRSRLKAWALCAAATVIGYLPWLLVAVRQLRMVGESYWISPITKRDLVSFFQYPFRLGGGRIVAWAIALFLVLSYLVLVLGAIRRSIRLRDRGETDAMLFCINGAVNWGGTVLFGIVASLLFRPVFVARYMVPALGSLWLGYAILLGRLEGRAKYLRFAAVAVLLCAALLNVRSFTVSELQMKSAFGKLEARLETIEEDARFVANNDHIERSFAHLTGKETYLWETEPIKIPYPGLNFISDAAEIRNWLLDGKPVYFLERFPSAKPTAVEAFDGSGIDYSDTGAYALEHYSLKIYRLEIS